jgi:hypothetical protein
MKTEIKLFAQQEKLFSFFKKVDRGRWQRRRERVKCNHFQISRRAHLPKPGLPDFFLTQYTKTGGNIPICNRVSKWP